MKPSDVDAVKAVIIRDGAVLLLQRNPATAPTDNWDLPGGRIDADEDETEALRREIREELGVQARIGDPVDVWSFHDPRSDERIRVRNYRCTLVDDDITLSDEHIDHSWTEQPRDYRVKDCSLYDALASDGYKQLHEKECDTCSD